MWRNSSALLLLSIGLAAFAACDCGDDAPPGEDAGGGLDADGVDASDTDGFVPPTDGDTCVANGGTCSGNSDCCTTNCQGGTCMPGDMCAAVGMSCAGGPDCCTGQCRDTGGSDCDGAGDCICAPAAACRAQGTECMADGDCCNNLCDRPGGAVMGTCAEFGACSTAGEPCSGEGLSGSCCSTVCLDTGEGPRCQFLGGCRLQDELCTSDAQCCQGACEQDGTTMDGRPIMRCANAGSCLPTGEVCGEGGASSNCCPDGGGDDGCFPTGTGFRRCLGNVVGDCIPPGQPCDPMADAGIEGMCCTSEYPNIMCTVGRGGSNICCLPDGEECALGDQCCNGICAPDPADGVLRCNPSCIADGMPCSAAADCCGCGCISDGAGGTMCTSDTSLCAPCTGPSLGESCDPAGEACCNAPTVQCDATLEFPTCAVAL